MRRPTPLNKKKVNVSYTLSPEVVEELTKETLKTGVPRSWIVEMILRDAYGLPELEEKK